MKEYGDELFIYAMAIQEDKNSEEPEDEEDDEEQDEEQDEELYDIIMREIDSIIND